MIQKASSKPASLDQPAVGKGWDFEVFFDGDCPLCRREMDWLRRRDRTGRLLFTDIADPDFRPSETGRSMDDLMARIHGRLPDGTIVEGIEVFRRLYQAVGFRRAVAISRWPVIRHGLDLVYRLFARYRLRLTGRCRVDGRGAACRPAAGDVRGVTSDIVERRSATKPAK